MTDPVLDLRDMTVTLATDRGRVLLLVDDTMATPLATELATFIRDLQGDGNKMLLITLQMTFQKCANLFRACHLNPYMKTSHSLLHFLNPVT